MITGKEDLLQSLIEVFLMEKGTKEFYLLAAARAQNQDAKLVFADLSSWEEEHMEFIQSLYRSIQDDRDLEGFELFKKRSPSPDTEAGIPVRQLEAKLERYDFADDLGALTLALEIEGKAYNLYRKLSGSAADRSAQVVFSEMMGQELKHIDYLKGMQAKLA